MPRLAGVNVFAALLAAIVFFLFGWLWYGILFMEPWMAATGVVEDEAEPVWLAVGFLIALITVAVIAKVMDITDGAGPAHGVRIALLLWVGFGLTATLYELAYGPAHNMTLFLINVGYPLVGWAVAGAIIGAMTRKA